MPKLLRITTIDMSLKLLLTDQLKYMKENGFEVYAASAHGPFVDDIEKREGVDHFIIPFKRDISLLQDLRALFITINLIIRLKPDIVHTHTPKAGLIGMLASWLLRVPHRIHTVAGMPSQELNGIKKRIVVFMEKLCYSCAKEVWPNSMSLKEHIEKEKLCNIKKLKVIGRGSSNGIDFNEFDKDNIDHAIINEVKQSISYDPNCKYLLFIGRLVSQKGISELVRAFLRLNTELKNLKLILVGPFEDDRDAVPDVIKESILNDRNIITTGFSNKVKYFLAISDLCVFPSHREGFPNVPMQSGAMKCPIICSEIGGNIDLISDKNNGLLFRVKDVDDLYNKLKFALTHEQEMKRLADNNYLLLKEHYSRPVVHAGVLKEYKQILK